VDLEAKTFTTTPIGSKTIPHSLGIVGPSAILWDSVQCSTVMAKALWIPIITAVATVIGKELAVTRESVTARRIHCCGILLPALAMLGV
jgi:electron transfer flavoprotein alpha/beta subunit